ncbi:MAG: hypothetical protein ACRC0L_01665, partial [Angustibacter sp.]
MNFSGRHYTITLDIERLNSINQLLKEWTAVWSTASTNSANFPNDIGESWTGKTATAVKREMTGLAEVTQRASDRIAAARLAVEAFQNL